MQTLLYIKGVSIKRQESGRPAVYGPGGSRTRVRSSLVTKTSTRLSHLLYLAWTAGRAEQSHAGLKEVLFLIFLKAYVLSEAAACLDHTVTAAIPYGLVSYETLTDKKVRQRKRTCDCCRLYFTGKFYRSFRTGVLSGFSTLRRNLYRPLHRIYRCQQSAITRTARKGGYILQMDHRGFEPRTERL